MGANQSEVMRLSFNNPAPTTKNLSAKSSQPNVSPAQETPPPAVGSPEYIAAEFDKNNKYWEDRLNRLEESHKHITETMLDANAEAQVEMEKILPKVPEKDAQPPCKSLLDKVMKCYQSNAQETLKCTGDVDNYKKCLGEAMGVIVGAEEVAPIPDDCQKDLILEELKKEEAAKKKNKQDPKAKKK